MSTFTIQLLLSHNIWITRYSIRKNVRYSDSSTDWTRVSLNFDVDNCGIKPIYDQKDTPHAGICFSKISISNSAY